MRTFFFFGGGGGGLSAQNCSAPLRKPKDKAPRCPFLMFLPCEWKNSRNWVSLPSFSLPSGFMKSGGGRLPGVLRGNSTLVVGGTPWLETTPRKSSVLSSRALIWRKMSLLLPPPLRTGAGRPGAGGGHSVRAGVGWLLIRWTTGGVQSNRTRFSVPRCRYPGLIYDEFREKSIKS